MDRKEKLTLIAAMLMVQHNGKCRAVDALTCAEHVLTEIEAEVYKDAPLPPCGARSTTGKPH